MSPDVHASIKARLLTKAKERGEELELFLLRYACERFLYRLGASQIRGRCILKGASLLTIWLYDPYRSTRDVDLLALGLTDAVSIGQIVRAICAVPCPEDGMVFDGDSVKILPLREQEEYQGYRAILEAFLGKARIRLQVDFGLGDAVVPNPEDAEYPTIIKQLPAPWLRTYPLVGTIAEKFEAMVTLGRRNSRMKDFHDVWALSSEFVFDGPTLKDAVLKCFERRKTSWTPEPPDVLAPEFYVIEGLRDRWNNYVRAGAFRTAPPPGFETIGERVRTFLGPVRDSIVGNYSLEKEWPAGGAWK